VTESGVLRPTTRSPVLVHNPADANWFGADRLLPELERVHHATHDPHALQLVPVDVVPRGLAILDAPDIDSVEESNRLLAAQLLREGADAAYDDEVARLLAATADGTMLRGEVLVRWQEFVGTGELLRTLETKVGWLRDRMVNAIKGKPQQAERVSVAVESS